MVSDSVDVRWEVRRRVEQMLRVEVVRPGAGVMQRIRDVVRAAGEIVVVWVEGEGGLAPDSEEWRQTYAALNMGRDRLREMGELSLVLAGPRGLDEQVAARAPDLMSVIRPVLRLGTRLDPVVEASVPEGLARRLDELCVRSRRIVATTCRRHSFIGSLENTPKPVVELSDVFVAPELEDVEVASGGDHWGQGLVSRSTTHELSDVIEILDSPSEGRGELDIRSPLRRLVIVGDPGSGKSMLCRWIAVELSERSGGKVPVLLRVREGIGGRDSLIEASVRTLESNFHVSFEADEVRALFEDGRAMLIVDGLDESRSGSELERIEEWLVSLCAAYPRVSIVATSRSVGYADAPLPFWTLRIRPFDDERLERFVRMWSSVVEPGDSKARAVDRASLMAALAAAPRARELARNPLLGTMIALVHRYRGSLPGRRAELYQSIVKLMLETRPKHRGHEFSGLDPGTQWMLLEQWSLWLQERRDEEAGDDVRAWPRDEGAGLVFDEDTFVRRLRGIESNDEPTPLPGRDDMEERSIIDGLAKVFNDREQATVLAKRAGVPPERMPSFEMPLGFWTKLVQEVRNGLLPGGVGDLIREAKMMYPHNPIFAGRSDSPSRDWLAREGHESPYRTRAREISAEKLHGDWLHWLEREGLLASAGPGKYSFTYLTLMEYLASRALRWRYGQDINGLSEFLASVALKPHWREVVLLVLGGEAENHELVSSAIRAVLMASGSFEGRHIVQLCLGFLLEDLDLPCDLAEEVLRRIEGFIAHDHEWTADALNRIITASRRHGRWLEEKLHELVACRPPYLAAGIAASCPDQIHIEETLSGRRDIEELGPVFLDASTVNRDRWARQTLSVAAQLRWAAGSSSAATVKSSLLRLVDPGPLGRLGSLAVIAGRNLRGFTIKGVRFGTDESIRWMIGQRSIKVTIMPAYLVERHPPAERRPGEGSWWARSQQVMRLWKDAVSRTLTDRPKEERELAASLYDSPQIWFIPTAEEVIRAEDFPARLLKLVGIEESVSWGYVQTEGPIPPNADAADSDRVDLLALFPEVHAARLLTLDFPDASRATRIRLDNLFIHDFFQGLAELSLERGTEHDCLPLLLALGLAQYQTTWSWPRSTLWRQWLSSPPPADWLAAFFWHLCWAVGDVERFDEHRANARACLDRADWPELAQELRAYEVRLMTVDEWKRNAMSPTGDGEA